MASPTPQIVAPREAYKHLTSLIDAHGVRYVRVQWVDLNNQVRCRVLSASHLRNLLDSNPDRPGVTLTKATLGLVVLQVAPGFSAVGEHLYVIDPSSFRLCSYAPGHAVLFGFFQEQVAIPRPGGLSFEVPFCPRTVLSRLVRYAAEELGIQFLVGVETEFTLLKSVRPIVAVNDAQWSASLALNTGAVESRVMEEIADAIQADGIELQMYHSEGAPGQYEIITGPMAPLEAADAVVHTRETIYNIASKHELRATFAPRLDENSCGSGAHTHVSVRGRGPPAARASTPTLTYDFLTPLESAFLAGLMHHLPSVIALTLPLSASYARMKDGIWSGGTWLCWGVDNREAPVRLTKHASPASRNFEIKPVDGTSNPYLAIAGILACGVLGVRDGLPLTVGNCDVPDRTAAELTGEEREAMGITGRFPLSIDEARKRLDADGAIKEVLGAELVERFLGVNEMLEKALSPRQGEYRSHVVSRLVDNY